MQAMAVIAVSGMWHTAFTRMSVKLVLPGMGVRQLA